MTAVVRSLTCGLETRVLTEIRPFLKNHFYHGRLVGSDHYAYLRRCRRTARWLLIFFNALVREPGQRRFRYNSSVPNLMDDDMTRLDKPVDPRTSHWCQRGLAEYDGRPITRRDELSFYMAEFRSQTDDLQEDFSHIGFCVAENEKQYTGPILLISPHGEWGIQEVRPDRLDEIAGVSTKWVFHDNPGSTELEANDSLFMVIKYDGSGERTIQTLQDAREAGRQAFIARSKSSLEKIKVIAAQKNKKILIPRKGRGWEFVGPVTAETDHHAVQEISKQTIVAHTKFQDAFTIGQNYSICYSLNGTRSIFQMFPGSLNTRTTAGDRS